MLSSVTWVGGPMRSEYTATRPSNCGTWPTSRRSARDQLRCLLRVAYTKGKLELERVELATAWPRRAIFWCSPRMASPVLIPRLADRGLRFRVHSESADCWR